MNPMHPRVSCCWVFATPPEEGLDRLGAMGFGSIELWPAPVRRWGLERWRRALSSRGMAVS